MTHAKGGVANIHQSTKKKFNVGPAHKRGGSCRKLLALSPPPPISRSFVSSWHGVRCGLVLGSDLAIFDHMTASAPAAQHVNIPFTSMPHPFTAPSATIALAIDAHSLVISISPHILPQTLLLTTLGSPRAANTTVTCSLEDGEVGPSTLALLDRIVIYGFHTLLYVHRLFSIRTPARLLLYLSISLIRSCALERRRMGLSLARPTLYFPFTFLDLSLSYLAHNCVSQPYKYPCAHLTEQQATTAPSLSCLVCDSIPSLHLISSGMAMRAVCLLRSSAIQRASTSGSCAIKV